MPQVRGGYFSLTWLSFICHLSELSLGLFYTIFDGWNELKALLHIQRLLRAIGGRNT